MAHVPQHSHSGQRTARESLPCRLPPCRSWELKSGCQTWQLAPLPTEPCHWSWNSCYEGDFTSPILPSWVWVLSRLCDAVAPQTCVSGHSWHPRGLSQAFVLSCIFSPFEGPPGPVSCLQETNPVSRRVLSVVMFAFVPMSSCLEDFISAFTNWFFEDMFWNPCWFMSIVLEFFFFLNKPREAHLFGPCKQE